MLKKCVLFTCARFSVYFLFVHDREVVDSNPGQVMPKMLKMVPASFLPGAHCSTLKEKGERSKHGKRKVKPSIVFQW